MKKETFTKKEILHMIQELGLSNRKFCALTELNRGDFSKFMRGLKPLSAKNVEKIYKFAVLNDIYEEPKKSVWQRIVEFIKR